ncbi:MAG: hypothetical protein ACXWPM_11170, partial [Bdellovibrionota bacterium]
SEDRAAIGGLLSSVSAAVQATDAARLLGERALFYAQRAPFLMRMQARLSAHELIEDTGIELSGLSQLPEIDQRITALLMEMQKSMMTGQLTMNDAKDTLSVVRGLFTQIDQSPNTIKAANELLGHLAQLANDWSKVATIPKGDRPMSQMAGIAAQAETEADRLMKKGFWLGAALIGFASVGFAGSKIAVQAASKRISRRAS